MYFSLGFRMPVIFYVLIEACKNELKHNEFYKMNLLCVFDISIELILKIKISDRKRLWDVSESIDRSRNKGLV